MQVLTLPLPSRRDCTVSEISHSLLSYMAAPLVAQGSVPRFRESTFRVPRRCVRESQYGNVTFLLHTTPVLSCFRLPLTPGSALPGGSCTSRSA